jgi:hypothetical protein
MEGGHENELQGPQIPGTLTFEKYHVTNHEIAAMEILTSFLQLSFLNHNATQL